MKYMALLENEIQTAIDRHKAQSGVLFGNGQIQEAIEQLILAWDLLPPPKFNYDESYHLSRYITQMALKGELFSLARNWSSINRMCDPERLDDGVKEFLAATVEFEVGDLELAFKFFEVAYEKSNGTCFDGKETKYRRFFMAR